MRIRGVCNLVMLGAQTLWGAEICSWNMILYSAGESCPQWPQGPCKYQLRYYFSLSTGVSPSAWNFLISYQDTRRKTGRHWHLCDTHFLNPSNWGSNYISFNSDYLGTCKYFVYFMVITIWFYSLLPFDIGVKLMYNAELWENLIDGIDC